MPTQLLVLILSIGRFINPHFGEIVIILMLHCTVNVPKTHCRKEADKQVHVLYNNRMKFMFNISCFDISFLGIVITSLLNFVR